MTTATDTEKLVRRYYSAFNAGDVDGMLACVTEDVVHDINQGERRMGKSRFHAFCARMAHHYNEQLKDIVVMVAPRWRTCRGRVQRRGPVHGDRARPPARQRPAL